MININKYKLFFGCINSIGIKVLDKLLEIYGSEEEIYNLSDLEIDRIDCITDKQKANIKNARKEFDIDKNVDKVLNMGMKVSFYGDINYPARLLDIDNPPYQLFYYGELPKDNIPSVSIIGARMCSNYGLENAKIFASELVKNGVQIVSGMASGVDGISQKAAVNCGGKSYAILGSGVDICYPAGNKSLYNDLKEKGGVISEFSPGTKPLASNFPQRNRIISGLSDIVLVVEAKEKSGTAITVNMALNQGRDVYAIPGRINESLSLGCNKMIRDGAGIALTPDDLLCNFYNLKSEKNLILNNKYKKLNEEYKKIIFLLENKQMNADEIQLVLNYPDISKLKIILFKMVLENIIKENLGTYSIL